MITLNLKIKDQEIELTIEEACEIRDELDRLLSGYMSEKEKQAYSLIAGAHAAVIESDLSLYPVNLHEPQTTHEH